MTFRQSLEYISLKRRLKATPSLESIENLISLYGNPQGDLDIVHVAGTNGKGSISTMMSNIFEDAGYKTGLFISPYVVHFCERIQINGQNIGEQDFADIIERLKAGVEILEKEGLQFAEFDIITAAALLYFKEQGCQRVVLEVGLGGRFDATNVIQAPLAAVITHIDLDHTEILGDTYEKIASEKCGIIKEGTGLVVSYPRQHTDAQRVITDACNFNNVQCVIPTVENVRISDCGATFEYDKMKVTVNMAGEHQVYNAATAAATAKNLGIDDKYVISGIKRTVMPARVEIIKREPLVVLDGSHNKDGIDALCRWIDCNCKQKPVALISMLKDKNYEESFEKICSRLKGVVVTEIDSPRAVELQELKKTAQRYCECVFAEHDYNMALKKADEISQGSAVIICGSLYLASYIRPKATEYFKNK